MATAPHRCLELGAWREAIEGVRVELRLVRAEIRRIECRIAQVQSRVRKGSQK
jgi:hypothetical protein